MYKLGIDIGGTKINIGLLNAANDIVAAENFMIDSAENLVNAICIRVQGLLNKNSISIGDVLSCGIGIPGTVSKDGRIVKKAPNLRLHTSALADEFEKILLIPVKLIQDSRAAAWGEYVAGYGQGLQSVVCVTLGTGIGTGLVINGNIYDGAFGTAGELGHIPVTHDSERKCGCGKYGCLEKYVAGKGLAITAEELFGKDSTAKDLFHKAKEGNRHAIDAIQKSVEILGKAMVSAVNFLSPDCLLFSGGMIEQKELFINPLIEYVERHCYSAGDKKTFVGLAALGENAPLVGAALMPNIGNTPTTVKKNPLTISASVMCADMLHLADTIKEIEDAGIEYLHCDIMDNHFVPNLMLCAELLNKLRQASNLPFDFHIMAEQPETIIEKLDIRPADIISIHFESTYHVQRILDLIQKKGAIPAIAINPATYVESVREVLDDIQMLLIMTVNPGFSGQKLVMQSLDKIKRARCWLDSLGYENIRIEVDGNCSFENVPKMYEAGADIIVAGTSSIFHSDWSIKAAVEKLISDTEIHIKKHKRNG